MSHKRASSSPERGSDEPTARSAEGEVSLDVMFEILKNSRRRMVLEYLQEAEDEVKLSDLADVVTARENDTDVASITSTERKRVYVGLYQFHLPKMDDMGIIDFDQDRGDIQLAEKGRKLLRAHERNSSPTRRWHCLYFGVGTVGLLAAGSALLVGSLLLAAIALVVQSLVLAGLAVGQTVEFHGGLPIDFRTPRFEVPDNPLKG